MNKTEKNIERQVLEKVLHNVRRYGRDIRINMRMYNVVKIDIIDSTAVSIEYFSIIFNYLLAQFINIQQLK